MICSCVSSNTKLPVAHLSVAMSCDEKNNKRRKKRSKQSSEANSHAPKSVENREVCRPKKHTQCSFHQKKKRINTIRSEFQVMYICCFDGNFLFPSSFSLGLGGLLKMECLFFT